MKVLLAVLFLVGCGSDDKAPAEEPYFTAGQYLALQGDNTGTYKSEAALSSPDYKDCSFTVKTADLSNLEVIDGHEFKRVGVAGNACDYHMSIEGLLTRTVKICEGHAEVSISCHAQ